MDEADELQARAQVWNHVYSFARSLSLNSAVEMGIPDIIRRHGRPIPLSHLSSLLAVDAGRLRRFMRYLVDDMGLFAGEAGPEGGETYGLTPLSQALVRDAENSVVPMVTAGFDVLILPWHHVAECLVGGGVGEESRTTPVFERVYGAKLWEYARTNAGLGRRLDAAMDCDTRLTMRAVVGEGVGAAAFGGVSSLVDVGGGTGAAARAVADAFPQVNCTVLDHPDVIETAAAATECRGVELIAGDMFDFVPRADAALLKWILHNWGDEECLMILRRCMEAIPRRGGKVIVIDTVMDDSRIDEFSTARMALDMEMLLLFGGKERTEAEWRALFERTGFRRCEFTPIKSSIHSLMVAYP